MNEALMKHVERVVRPVRAGKIRKLAMRRELLAHLTAIYDEELTKCSDESAALAAAKDRFGQPVELTRELDRSVPWHARVIHLTEHPALADWFGWRLTAPWWRFALGVAAGIVVLHVTIGALLVLFFVLAPAGYGDPLGVPLAIGFLSYSMFGEFLFLMSVRAVYLLAFRSRSSWRWPAILAILAGSCLFAIGVGWVFFWQLGVAEANSRLPRIAFVSAIEIPLIVFLAVLAIRYVEWRDAPYREWSRLQIDE